ncbi:MAG TPA: carbohydrate binding domain-containing protein [Chthoniobacteraceae bacterium]|nr:carbohydrate binding domain-containing protein [Chthoniobacteraceae bacterium]
MKTKIPILAGIAAAALTSLAQAAEPFPFVLPWDDATPSVTNVSAWLDKPAGGRGFVAARDGHLFAGDQRIRFFGVNIAFGGNFPTHADAEKVAARMAKFGINCVRFHHMDSQLPPTGLLQKDKRTLDPEMLDRLDYFIAQLKKNGIYANLNLHVSRDYPDMPKWDGAPSYFKGVDNFFPPMIEQQREYARALLTHANPFTGTAYVDEPAVAFIEINNENGLMSEWNGGSLDAMPDPFAAELRKQWNEWLAKKYGGDEKLASAWKQGAEPLGGEMLQNGSFAKAFEKWNLEQHGGAKAAISFAAAQDPSRQALAVKVEQPGKESWHVQFSQGGLKLEGGRSYTVTFRARADKPRKIHASLSQTHEPWKVLATHEVKLSAEWQPVRLTIAPNASDDKARLAITGLGSEPGEFFFDNISLRPGGIEAFREGEKLGTIDIFRKADVAARTLAAQRDWNRFLFDTEVGYWPEMRRFIRDELHAKSLVLGSATGFSPWPVQAMLDVVDAHSYWQHPHFPRRPWDADDWTVKNESMAGAAEGGALQSLAMRRVADKPFIVTEYNASAPNTFSSEAFLELCALAGLQDWDGVFAFAFCHRKDDWDARKITSFFDIDQHPTKMATLPAAVALFCRGDVHPPAKAHVAEPTLDDAIETIRTASSWHHASAYGILTREMFEHPIAMRIGNGQKNSPNPDTRWEAVRSDNGELVWDTNLRRMLIQTPRSAGVVGYLPEAEAIDLGDIKIVAGKTVQEWATLTLTVMDGADFKTARRVLITATGYAANADMRWKDAEHTSVGRNWGNPPSVVEGIAATITLPHFDKAKMWALDERGQRRTEIPVKASGGKTVVEIGPADKTLWYEIAADQ